MFNLRPIRYNAIVEYQDLYGIRKEVSYSIFALDDEDARNITLELFLIDEGVADDMTVTVEGIRASSEVDMKITKLLASVLWELNKLLNNANYSEFLRIYENFSGKYLVLGETPSYYITFMGFTLKLELKDKVACVSREEIVYTDDEGREYLIRGGDVYVSF